LMLRNGSLEHSRTEAAGNAREADALLLAFDWLAPSSHRDVLEALVDYVHGRTR
ncbi:MAG: polyprenyl synthetase family protein, partial [Mycolicibacterium sp.]|nr:polyprenyl synthetase family protein [Mycolicibacterium sp.]